MIVVKDKMKSKTYKLNRKDLLVLVRYKHSKGDQKIPSTGADLEAQWNKTKHRASPNCSPNNSDNKEKEDVDDEEGGEMGTTGLVFGHVFVLTPGYAKQCTHTLSYCSLGSYLQ